jgi:hypothetical protein
MLKTITFSAVALVFTGCTTLAGDYAITAFDKEGKPLTKNGQLTANGSGIYTMRNAICAKYPGAKVIIKSIRSGEEPAGESPYQCR